MPTADADAALLLRLYDDASSGRGLQGALTDIAKNFGALAAHLMGSDFASGAPLWDVAADLQQGALRETAVAYTEHHWRTDPRRARGMALLSPGNSWCCQNFLDEREVSGSEFFQDFFLPMDLRWTMVGRLPTAHQRDTFQGRTQHVDLALVRPLASGAFEVRDQQRLAHLMPHLRQALRVQQQLRNMDSAAHALQAAATGSLLLDDQLRLVAASPGVADALSIRIGSLAFGGTASRRTDERLAQALRDTLRDGAMRHLELGRDQGLPERMWLTLTRRQPEAGGGGAPQVLMLVQWPERRHRVRPEVLMQLFSLTRREAEIGCALVEGKTPREIWTEHGVSAATVRTQLVALFNKTDTTGQVDFVRLVMGLATGHESPP
jgi:DNA-binding CsgD family transcriptional regulator